MGVSCNTWIEMSATKRVDSKCHQPQEFERSFVDKLLKGVEATSQGQVNTMMG